MAVQVLHPVPKRPVTKPVRLRAKLPDRRTVEARQAKPHQVRRNLPRVVPILVTQPAEKKLQALTAVKSSTVLIRVLVQVQKLVRAPKPLVKTHLAAKPAEKLVPTVLLLAAVKIRWVPAIPKVVQPILAVRIPVMLRAKVLSSR